MSRAAMSTGRQLERLWTCGTLAGMTDGQLLARFVSAEDESAGQAFEAIVQRHGRMVFRVCREIVRDVHTAEDAFQATFLVLARKARHLQERELLANWLYGVALRTARRTKVVAARHCGWNGQLAAHEQASVKNPHSEQADRDRVVHEEIERLPRGYRIAVIACYLEGRSQAEAAQVLQLSESTIRGRLARARKLLGQRLTRRGIGPSASFLAHQNYEPPTSLVEFTTRSVLSFMKRDSVMPEITSGMVRRITEGVLLGMQFKYVTTIVAMTAILGLIGSSAVLVAKQPVVVHKLCDQSQTECLPLNELGQATEPFSELKNTEQTPNAVKPVTVNQHLLKCVPEPIVRTIPVSKDCMILSYLPEWNFGNVDNIGIGNNDGGVRTLIDWPKVPAEEASAPDRKFLLALYSRKTISHPPASAILAFEILEKWSERTSWTTKPCYSSEPAATYGFEPGDGWKLFDVTSLVRNRITAGQVSHGIILRFLNEDVPGRSPEVFSDYKLVSREGSGEWTDKHPVLLVVQTAKRREN